MAWAGKDPVKHLAAMDAVRNSPRYANLLREVHGDLGFAVWLALVDHHLGALGITHNDLADFSSRDLYEAGTSPKEGAQAALENDDCYSMLVDR